MTTSSEYIWKFHRIGGIDQLSLQTASELRHLEELDPKLWAVLSCPSAGLEFDARTLALVDTDKDGRIRIPEVKAAVAWACERLHDPAVLAESRPAMPLTRINTETQEGKRILAAAKAILQDLGKDDAEELSQDDVSQAAAKAAGHLFNGDGILPLHPDLDKDMLDFIRDALAVIGGVADADGEPGINQELADTFLESLQALQVWYDDLAKASAPLGDNTSEAWALLIKLKPKIDDYFLRCDLASYAPQAKAVLNIDDTFVPPQENGIVEKELLTTLPLSRIEGGRPLHINDGLNPAWRNDVTRFFELARPLLHNAVTVSREEWLALQKHFAAFSAALALKPKPATVQTDFPPTATPESLGEARIREILSSDFAARFAELIRQDAEAPTDSAGIAAVERLVLYHAHLHRLLMNFVSMFDFYSLRREAAFQSGVLYLDGRSCKLCLPVADLEKHAALAAHSQLCLVYCRCRRKAEQGGAEEETLMVAAMTAGDSDLLMEGRNGVYAENTGKNWEASVVKVVSNPISLRQALWDPYKRLGRMITTQLGKFASAKQEEQIETVGKKIAAVSSAAISGQPPAASPSFDIGKSVGIFAAIGLAIGAIGTAAASIARALFSLSWWQFPLLFLGAFLLISGPSLLLAWLKLRKRTLGPLLEASGWAVNSLVPINFTLGTRLTAVATLPPNAKRSYSDPLKPPSKAPWYILIAAILIGAAATWLWFNPGPVKEIVNAVTAEVPAASGGGAAAPGQAAP